jgi:hypothetical protein
MDGGCYVVWSFVEIIIHSVCVQISAVNLLVNLFLVSFEPHLSICKQRIGTWLSECVV